MTTMKWFGVPMSDRERVEARLGAAGFVADGDGYVDAQGRCVRFAAAEVQIGIPACDVVNEQEQLEFLLGVLGLDDENVRGL